MILRWASLHYRTSVRRRLMYAVLAGLVLVVLSIVSSLLTAQAQTAEPRLAPVITGLSDVSSEIDGIEKPVLVEPDWLTAIKAAERSAKATAPSSSPRVVTYDISTRGPVTASLSEFKALANSSLNDTRGWARLGVTFREVDTGGMFTLVLSTADQVPSFSSGCGSEYSCRVGRYVIINQDRWMGATPSWNGAGGSLRDYRHMVVNHETGHWLGHGHSHCAAPGQPARVMQQQSINLEGCTFNPWPDMSELWSSQLGIGL